MAAIKSATSIAALHLGLEADVGALVPGRYGDLVLVSGNPLKTINTLRRVRTVVKGGLVKAGLVKGGLVNAGLVNAGLVTKGLVTEEVVPPEFTALNR